MIFMSDQQVVIHEDEKGDPPSLGYLLGASLIVILDIGLLKWMFQEEIDHSLGIPPS